MLIVVTIIITGFLFLASLFFVIVQIIDPDDYQDGPPTQIRILIPILIFLFGVLSTLIAVWYYYPDIRPRKTNRKISANSSIIDVVLYISNSDEVQVINAVKTLPHGAYQFEIANLASLSRMKVHRVIKRLVERDILTRLGEGRNSKLFLAEWLTDISELPSTGS